MEHVTSVEFLSHYLTFGASSGGGWMQGRLVVRSPWNHSTCKGPGPGRHGGGAPQERLAAAAVCNLGRLSCSLATVLAAGAGAQCTLRVIVM